MTELVTQRLGRFVTDTGFDQLPSDVVDYTKLLVLDSIACGLGASQMERTRMGHRVAARLGDGQEATLFGMDRLVPATHAASANAEIMNLLDADDTFFNSAHFVILNVAAALAEAERTGGSGAELVRAVALGFDVSARFNLASSFMTFEDGEFRWSELFGSGYAAMGAAASAGIVLGLDANQMADAFALVAGTAPGARNSNAWVRREYASYKHAPNYNLVQNAMTSVLLAEHGYRGELDLVDLVPGFIEGQGFVSRDLEPLTRELGSQWWIRDSAVKFLPSCRYTHAPAHTLEKFMAANGLGAGDIESIEVRLNPAAFSMSVFNDPARSFDPDDHRSPMHAQFNIPFVLANVALGNRPGAGWYTPENLADPRVWEVADRITTSADPSLAEEWDSEINDGVGRPRRTRGSLTIRAGGQELQVDEDFAPGDPWSKETAPTWADVERKLRNFCHDIVPGEQLTSLVAVVRDLDKVDDVRAHLTPLLQAGAR
ncbi:MAG: MmgE/PrpD family protein [Nocardioides sp.]|uniref:MmgE/PrpD family protein n=1 Tax=Nocardioides sp. TaxID=35761 RepID=UPI003F11AF68